MFPARLIALPRVAALALATALAVGSGALGCAGTQRPQLKVLSVEQTARQPSTDMVLFVEVTNPAARPLELHRLQYSFAPSSHRVDLAPVRGEVTLRRTVEAGAAVVVEVPLPVDEILPRGEELLLAGRLYATQDQLERSFAVQARVAAR